MTTPNIRAALERLVKTDDGCSAAEWSDAIAAARAALAEPEPEPPADGEVAELVAWLLLNRDSFEKAYPHQPTYNRFTRVAELLSQLASRP